MLSIDGTAASTVALATPQPRLVHAAHEFEAQMMQELLKPMTSGDGLDEEDSGSGSALGEFAAEALGKGLSERGGFGIATGIVRELSTTGNKTGSREVTGKKTGILSSNRSND
jgi:Rod binding domain-containing protein